ncbi:exported hypothetical protein [Candidatus Accumulibacter aalborgensis]|uniref:Uncharacterized protein n=1 Tax=Candidatus Accumulibacter aalborgensis TaxID=1860102 RepID=A0A1A8XLH6_9PROT|nr:exported hypothetical protein [Candidatus Accumulibacter aalborgensis]
MACSGAFVGALAVAGDLLADPGALAPADVDVLLAWRCPPVLAPGCEATLAAGLAAVLAPVRAGGLLTGLATVLAIGFGGGAASPKATDASSSSAALGTARLVAQDKDKAAASRPCTRLLMVLLITKPLDLVVYCPGSMDQ